MTRQVNRPLHQPGPVLLHKYWNSQDNPERMQNGSITWNRTFGPSFFVETVVTAARLDWRFSLNQPTAGQNLAPKLGVPNPFNIAGAPTLTNFGFSLNGVGLIPRAD